MYNLTTEIIGKEVESYKGSIDDLIITFTDKTFAIFSDGIFLKEANILHYSYDAVEIGICSQEEIDVLKAEREAKIKEERVKDRYELYLKLKKEFE